MYSFGPITTFICHSPQWCQSLILYINIGDVQLVVKRGKTADGDHTGELKTLKRQSWRESTGHYLPVLLARAHADHPATRRFLFSDTIK